MTIKKNDGMARFYYDPATGLWCRRTQKNAQLGCADEWFSWVPFEKLLDRHQSKLAVMQQAEVGKGIPDFGFYVKSRVHKGLIRFHLFNEHWRKKDGTT